MRKLFRVSTKALLLNKTLDKILVIHMEKDDDWGLPGGHIDEGETPDTAIARELMEECGVHCDSLDHRDFFAHSNGKIILAFYAISNDSKIVSQQDNLEGTPKWLTKDEFMKIQIEPVYRDFVIKNWINN